MHLSLLTIYISWEMTPTSIGGEKQACISGGVNPPLIMPPPFYICELNIITESIQHLYKSFIHNAIALFDDTIYILSC